MREQDDSTRAAKKIFHTKNNISTLTKSNALLLGLFGSIGFSFGPRLLLLSRGYSDGVLSLMVMRMEV